MFHVCVCLISNPTSSLHPLLCSRSPQDGVPMKTFRKPLGGKGKVLLFQQDTFRDEFFLFGIPSNGPCPPSSISSGEEHVLSHVCHIHFSKNPRKWMLLLPLSRGGHCGPEKRRILLRATQLDRCRAGSEFSQGEGRENPFPPFPPPLPPSLHLSFRSPLLRRK